MKEIPLKYLLPTLIWKPWKRIGNAAIATASYVLSSLLRRQYVWGKPFILTVEPTNLCNLKCPLCITGNGRMTRETGQLSYPIFEQIMNELGDYIFYLLLYQQGEPFINNELLRFIRAAKKKRIFVTTSSNGHYFDPETATEVVHSGLDSMIISVDGAAQESYRRYRVQGKLEQVLTGIRHLVREKKRQASRKPVLYLQFIVMKHNEGEIHQMAKLAKNVGADHFLTKTVHVENAREARQWLPANPSFRRYAVSDNEIELKPNGKGICPRPWTSSLINWDGSVVPCCFDKDAEHLMGALADTKEFSQIWRSRHYESFRKSMLDNREELDICANCSQGIRLFI